MRSYAQQKAALTRAIKSGDPERVREECRRAVSEWNSQDMYDVALASVIRSMGRQLTGGTSMSTHIERVPSPIKFVSIENGETPPCRLTVEKASDSTVRVVIERYATCEEPSTRVDTTYPMGEGQHPSTVTTHYFLNDDFREWLAGCITMIAESA